MKIERIYHFRIPVILMETMDKTEWSSMADNMALLPKLMIGTYQMDNFLSTFKHFLNIGGLCCSDIQQLNTECSITYICLLII